MIRGLLSRFAPPADAAPVRAASAPFDLDFDDVPAAAPGETPPWLYEASYPGLGQAAREGMLSREDACALALHFVRAHFPTAVAVFGFGSAFAARFRPYSDIDLVIVLPQGRFLRNRCGVFRGVPFDLHVFGVGAAEQVIRYAKRSGNASVLLPIATGEVLADPALVAEDIRTRFAQAFAEGPEPAPPRAVATLRHTVTTQLLDMAGGLNADEAAMAALAVYPMLMRLLFAQTRTWRHRGKWAARHGDSLFEDLVPRLRAAYGRAMADGDVAPLTDLALRILERSGGPLWSPYVDDLPLREA